MSKILRNPLDLVSHINYNGVKDKLEVVKESYVIDYTSPTFQTLVMEEEGGFDYRWVYGNERLSVKITSEGTNWWGQNVTTDILKDYTHQDRLGSTTNLSDVQDAENKDYLYQYDDAGRVTKLTTPTAGWKTTPTTATVSVWAPP